MMQEPDDAWRFLEQLSNGSKANFSARKPVSTAAAVNGDSTKWSTESTARQSTRAKAPKSQSSLWARQRNYQWQSSNQPRQFHTASNSGPSISNNNNRGPTNTSNNALESQENMIAKMYELVNASQQQTQANAKAIANMERQIAQMAEDQRRRDSGKLPSNKEVNPNHTQRAGKEHANVVETEWRKVTEDDLIGKESEIKTEKSEDKTKEGDPDKEDKEVQKEEQTVIAGIKQKKKDKKAKKKQEVPSMPSAPSINQPLWDELKNAPEDTKILQEMCIKNEKFKVPTLKTVRLTVKASEALLRTLPKKEKDHGSPLIIVTVGDVIIQNTLFDLGASVNVLPVYLYDKYKNEELEPRENSATIGRSVNKSLSDLEDAPALILGRPFLATAGAAMAYKTGDIDISFGTQKRRQNMFGCPITLPPCYDDKYLNNRPLMAPRASNGKGKNQAQESGSEEEEILWEAKRHPLASVDKIQLLDMIEMVELKHQQYEKDTRCREAKVFQILDAQQQCISQTTRCLGAELGHARRGSPLRAPRNSIRQNCHYKTSTPVSPVSKDVGGDAALSGTTFRSPFSTAYYLLGLGDFDPGGAMGRAFALHSPYLDLGDAYFHLPGLGRTHGHC
ncbi:hypothetical protein L2E82_17595 [Cichorium intybus]|uniref:Uncharacterized protein n=1 Tax=Cichorium intybus TaxID=13427 RepID=A0ACB9F9F7_CICIN|nr:hypothetical protein L2E82_17595 [Cichorium intybus]